MAAEETGISEETVVKMIDWYDFGPTINEKRYSRTGKDPVVFDKKRNA